MPNGEQAHVLIMEYIQGDTLYDLANRYKEAAESDKREHLRRLQKIVRTELAYACSLLISLVFVYHRHIRPIGQCPRIPEACSSCQYHHQ